MHQFNIKSESRCFRECNTVRSYSWLLRRIQFYRTIVSKLRFRLYARWHRLEHPLLLPSIKIAVYHPSFQTQHNYNESHTQVFLPTSMSHIHHECDTTSPHIMRVGEPGRWARKREPGNSRSVWVVVSHTALHQKSHPMVSHRAPSKYSASL